MSRVDEVVAALERGDEPDFMLAQEAEPITVDTMGGPEPDPHWRHVDRAGHAHARIGDDWPTLRWVIDNTYWCEMCLEPHDEGHWECRECGETLEPGMVNRGPRRLMVAGPVTTTLDGEVLTPEDTERVMAAWQASRP